MPRVGIFGLNLNGTYVMDFKTADFPGAPFKNGVGSFGGDQVVQRWRHTAGLNYDLGDFSATLTQTYYSGYRDQNPGPDGKERRVKAYELWDLSASYSISKALKLRGGIKNLLDTAPPVSNQVLSFLAGYDPSYTDPRGRTFFASLNYSLR